MRTALGVIVMFLGLILAVLIKAIVVLFKDWNE